MKPKIRYVPRWVAQTLVIPANTTVLASPAIFANTDVWPAQLHWLSVTGDVNLTTAETSDNAKSGGVGRRLAWELGLSQEGEINLVAGTTEAFFASNEFRRQCSAPYDDAIRFRFPIEYKLAPDSGLVTQVQTLDTLLSAYYPSLVVNGVRDEGRGEYEPAQIAGFVNGTLAYPTSMNIDQSDLFNSGKASMYLKEMLIKPSSVTLNPTPSTHFWPQMNKTAWRINPNNDIPWMPQDELIPAGNIAPFNRGSHDLWDEGPKAYTFPTGTKLKPRQRLTIRIKNLNETVAPNGDQTITICLFSLLEVS